MDEWAGRRVRRRDFGEDRTATRTGGWLALSSNESDTAGRTGGGGASAKRRGREVMLGNVDVSRCYRSSTMFRGRGERSRRNCEDRQIGGGEASPRRIKGENESSGAKRCGARRAEPGASRSWDPERPRSRDAGWGRRRSGEDTRARDFPGTRDAERVLTSRSAGEWTPSPLGWRVGVWFQNRADDAARRIPAANRERDRRRPAPGVILGRRRLLRRRHLRVTCRMHIPLVGPRARCASFAHPCPCGRSASARLTMDPP